MGDVSCRKSRVFMTLWGLTCEKKKGIKMLKRFIAVVGLAFSVSANAAIIQYDYVGAGGYVSNGQFSITYDAGLPEVVSYSLSYRDTSMGTAAPQNLVWDGKLNFNDQTLAFSSSRVRRRDPYFGNNADYYLSAEALSLGAESLVTTQRLYLAVQGKNFYNNITWSLAGVTDLSPSPVPLPAAAWLFGSALLGLGAFKRRKA
jgi:hypothetical protein